jgi:hypothetical protein
MSQELKRREMDSWSLWQKWWLWPVNKCEIILKILVRAFLLKFQLPVPDDQNGGLTCSQSQNSAIVRFSSCKFGVVVKDEELEDRGSSFLPGSVHKFRFHKKVNKKLQSQIFFFRRNLWTLPGRKSKKEKPSKHSVLVWATKNSLGQPVLHEAHKIWSRASFCKSQPG